MFALKRAGLVSTFRTDSARLQEKKTKNTLQTSLRSDMFIYIVHRSLVRTEPVEVNEVIIMTDRSGVYQSEIHSKNFRAILTRN